MPSVIRPATVAATACGTNSSPIKGSLSAPPIVNVQDGSRAKPSTTRSYLPGRISEKPNVPSYQVNVV